jgi:hypothetical protein
MIPASRIIGEPSKRMGVCGAMDTARILHKDGHENLIGFKSYDQETSAIQQKTRNRFAGLRDVFMLRLPRDCADPPRCRAAG